MLRNKIERLRDCFEIFSEDCFDVNYFLLLSLDHFLGMDRAGKYRASGRAGLWVSGFGLTRAFNFANRAASGRKKY